MPFLIILQVNSYWNLLTDKPNTQKIMKKFSLRACLLLAVLLYVYRTDGRFTVFSAADVDSITYSRYDATARFEVDVEAVNTTDALSQTLPLAMHYEGGVVNAQEVEVELVKTEYRKDMIVYDGHDNLEIGAQAVVYRDRYYSDGSIHTDSLKEGVAMTLYVSSIGVPDMDNVYSSASGGLDWTDEISVPGRPSKDLSEYETFVEGTYYDASNPQDGIYYYRVGNSMDNIVEYKHNGKYYKLSYWGRMFLTGGGPDGYEFKSYDGLNSSHIRLVRDK